MTANEIKSFTMKKYGFGYEAMNKIRVCKKCGKPTSEKILLCKNCGAFLPKQSLFEIYRNRHRTCKVCGTVLSDAMKYCPKCGKKNK